jgi:hypothetical protein
VVSKNTEDLHKVLEVEVSPMQFGKKKSNELGSGNKINAGKIRESIGVSKER